MKKIALIICLLCAFVQYAIADGYHTSHQAFQQAVELFIQGKFLQAKTNFTQCLNDPAFADVKGNVNAWINKCESAILEQNKNAQIAAETHKRKLAEKKKNQYYYISVIAPANISNYAKSMASEVLNRAGVNECQKLEDAWMVVTISFNVSQHEPIQGFYAAEGEGFVSVGYADETKSSGFRAVDALAQSPVGQADAERLVRNKLNYRLSHKLDDLIYGRPETEKVPEQIIALDLITPGIQDITASHLCNVMNSYISNKEGVKLTSILDMELNRARDKNAETLSIYAERDERAPVRELKGYNQIIYITIKESNGYLTFNASFQQHPTGVVITNATIDGSTFRIKKKNFNATMQEFVAKMLVARLGLGEYKIGDIAYIDDKGREVRFASIDGIHGSLFLDPAVYDLYPIGQNSNGIKYYQYTLEESIGVDPKEGWRLPSVEELKSLKDCKRFRLTNVYWTSEPAEKRCYKVVDFRYDTTTVGSYKDTRQRANIVAIREF